MNLTKVQRAIEQLEREAQELADSKACDLVFKELNIEDITKNG